MSDDSQQQMQKAFGERVRELRLKKELTQGECAAKAGMSEQHWWRIEDGRQNVSLRSLSRLAIALKVTMSDLLKGVPADAGGLGTRPYRRSE